MILMTTNKDVGLDDGHQVHSGLDGDGEAHDGLEDNQGAYSSLNDDNDDPVDLEYHAFMILDDDHRSQEP